MSQNVNQSNAIDLLVKVLTTTNALMPAAMPGVAAVVGIIKAGIKTGKTPAEIEAEASDSMATALRVRAKSEAQMGDQS